MKEALSNHSSQKASNGPINGQLEGSHKELAVTWVHKCFQVRFYSFLPTCFCACVCLWHVCGLQNLLLIQSWNID
jgi:hypothetical protein